MAEDSVNEAQVAGEMADGFAAAWNERAPGQVRRTRMTLVIEQRAAQWRIVAAHNTGIVTPAS
jgi:hypothetical protein